MKTDVSDSNEDDRRYDEAIVNINDMNDSFDKFNRRKKYDRRCYAPTY